METRYDNVTNGYVAVVVRADGRQQTERFRTREAFREWLMALERQLQHEQGDPMARCMSCQMAGRTSRR